MDETIKTVLIDESNTVTDLTRIICEKIGIVNCDEYSLQTENNNARMGGDRMILGSAGSLNSGDNATTLKRKTKASSNNNNNGGASSSNDNLADDGNTNTNYAMLIIIISS